MLRLNRIFRTSNFVCSRLCSSKAISDVKREKWDIFSSVCLERKPIITRELNDLEEQFNKLLLDVEYENSHKSNFELRMEQDEIREKKVKEGKVGIAEMDSFPQQTGQDFLDASTEELQSFKFASRKNDESVEKNLKSLERGLDRYLLLLVKEKIGKKPQWLLPQGKLGSDESLRQSAERVLKENCGNNIHARFFGNAPVGFYKYRYPVSVRTDDRVGAKIFFYKAQILSGQVDLSDSKYEDFIWAKRNELETLPYDYFKSVKMFLIDEDH